MNKIFHGFLLFFSIFFLNSLSARVWVVSQNNKLANDSNPGTTELPFLTISNAAFLAMPGDTVLVHSGIYRERVSPERGGEPGKYIVYMAASGEKVVIKGSEIWKNPWTPYNDQRNIYTSPINTQELFPILNSLCQNRSLICEKT